MAVCMLTSEFTVHMLKYIVGGHVCCSLIDDSIFIHSFIHGPPRDTIARSLVSRSPNTIETPRNEVFYLIISSADIFKINRNLLSISSLA